MWKLALPIFSVLLVCLSSMAWSGSSFSVDVVLDSPSTMSGQPLSLPSADNAIIEAHLVTIEPGAEVGRHKHPFPVFMYVLEGVLVVDPDDGVQQTYRAGEALVEDADMWINNSNPGNTPAKFLAVLNGERSAATVIFPE